MNVIAQSKVDYASDEGKLFGINAPALKLASPQKQGDLKVGWTFTLASGV